MSMDYDHHTATVIGWAEVAMKYHARNGGEESKARAIANLKNAAERLGFDLVKRKTPAEAHEAALAARRAEDDGGAAHAKSMGIDDLEWSR